MAAGVGLLRSIRPAVMPLRQWDHGTVAAEFPILLVVAGYFLDARSLSASCFGRREPEPLQRCGKKVRGRRLGPVATWIRPATFVAGGRPLARPNGRFGLNLAPPWVRPSRGDVNARTGYP